MTNRSLTYEAGEQARSRFHDRPMRFFNTAGPIIPADHYHVHPLQRLDLDEVLLLIERKQYFVLHAPRQTGKTSALLALMEELNGSGRYRCVYVNVEIGQSAREDVAEAMRAILGQLASRAEQILGDRSLREVVREVSEEAGPHGVLQEVLGRWAGGRRQAAGVDDRRDRRADRRHPAGGCCGNSAPATRSAPRRVSAERSSCAGCGTCAITASASRSSQKRRGRRRQGGAPGRRAPRVWPT